MTLWMRDQEKFYLSENESQKKIQDMEVSRDAFETLMKYSGTLSEDFDYKAELETARTEKYGNIKG